MSAQTELPRVKDPRITSFKTHPYEAHMPGVPKNISPVAEIVHAIIIADQVLSRSASRQPELTSLRLHTLGRRIQTVEPRSLVVQPLIVGGIEHNIQSGLSELKAAGLVEECDGKIDVTANAKAAAIVSVFPEVDRIIDPTENRADHDQYQTDPAKDQRIHRRRVHEALNKVFDSAIDRTVEQAPTEAILPQIFASVAHVRASSRMTVV